MFFNMQMKCCPCFFTSITSIHFCDIPLVYTPQVNSEPFEGGWMMKIKVSNAGDVDALLDAGAYEAHCEAGGH